MRSDGYGLVSRFYDRALEPLNAPLRQVAHRMCPPQPGWTVLDIGCGTGAALAEYAAAGCSVIGVDPSPAMIDTARRRLGPEADLRQADGPCLPVADGCADLVLISLVLHSISRPDAVALLTEAGRALAPAGRVLVTDFGTAGLRFPRGWAIRGRQHHPGRARSIRRRRPHTGAPRSRRPLTTQLRPLRPARDSRRDDAGRQPHPAPTPADQHEEQHPRRHRPEAGRDVQPRDADHPA